MSKNEFKYFLEKSNLLSFQVYELQHVNEQNRNSTYDNFRFQNLMINFLEDWTLFNKYVRESGIFIRPNIKVKLDEIVSIFLEISTVSNEELFNVQILFNPNFSNNPVEKYHQKVKPKMAEIEALVQKMIFPESQG